MPDVEIAGLCLHHSAQRTTIGDSLKTIRSPARLNIPVPFESCPK